jgi:hypothetical protein
MVTKEFVRPEGAGCAVTIDASPGAARTEVAGVNPWRGALQVRIAAEPREGAANEELIRFLAERCSVPRKEIRISYGATSSHKIVYIPLPSKRVRDLLGVG